MPFIKGANFLFSPDAKGTAAAPFACTVITACASLGTALIKNSSQCASIIHVYVYVSLANCAGALFQSLCCPPHLLSKVKDLRNASLEAAVLAFWTCILYSNALTVFPVCTAFTVMLLLPTASVCSAPPSTITSIPGSATASTFILFTLFGTEILYSVLYGINRGASAKVSLVFSAFFTVMLFSTGSLGTAFGSL